MAKKPVSLLHLHKLFREVWEKEWDSSKGDWRSNTEDGDKEVVEELGPGAMLRHQDDIFHPDNLV